MIPDKQGNNIKKTQNSNGRGRSEPGEKHPGAFPVVRVFGEMVKEQFFFDPEFQIEDEPEGEEGGQA
jgi:hypothetical protein